MKKPAFNFTIGFEVAPGVRISGTVGTHPKVQVTVRPKKRKPRHKPKS